MRESFVLHSEYIDDLPEDYRQKFLMYVYNYGIHEEIPVLKGLEQSLWIKIQRRIDLDYEAYNKRIEYLKEYRNKKKNVNNSESSQNAENSSECFKTFETFENIQTHSDIVNVNDIVSVNDIVIDTVSDATVKAPSTLSDSQKNYSKQIFTILKNAGLPCSKGNELTFLQTDFKNALAYIHNSSELKNFKSSDIIEAVKNYVEVLKDESCYITSKMNFFSLVKSKIFYNLIPGNFDKNNFMNFESKKSKAETPAPEKKVFSPKPCPSCGLNHVYWSQNKEMYICDDCGKSFDFDEYLGEL